jgi:septum formation protein
MPLFDPAQPRLVLASRSPRRKELLEQLGLTVEVAPAEVDETPRPGESPETYVRRLAEAKARAVALGIRGGAPVFVLGADTAVVLDGRILGKPTDAKDAGRMLRLLSGRAHEVLTGYVILVLRPARSGGEPDRAAGVVRTEVEFKALDEAEIETYVATGEPLDKAGAYAIQGVGGFMVRRINGSHSNVVGLPLCETIERLRRLGAIRHRGEQ